jgi:hypothetical protein
MSCCDAGKSGKRWEAHFRSMDEVWRGDLDGNGTPDYVFFGAGPYFNGRVIRGMIGGRRFPFIHPWSYGPTICNDALHPKMVIQPAVLREYGTRTKIVAATLIRKLDPNGISATIDPLAGCRSIQLGTVAYDQPHIRE